MRSSYTALGTAASTALLVALACGGGGDGSSGLGVTGGSAGSGAGTEGASGDSGAGGNGGSLGVGGDSGSNSGGTGAITVTGGSSGAGGAGGTGQDACAADTYQGERFPLDMFIMMDQSGSMDGRQNQNGGNNVWIPISDALKTFVQSPESADIGVGIGYFPLRVPCISPDPECCNRSGNCDEFKSECNASAYGQPDVPIGVLPGVSQPIIDSLNAHSPDGGTPTHPALQGAMQYALAHKVATPGRKTIVVLATDGRPNDCNSDVGNVSDVARAGFTDNDIQTFVIGIGNTGNLNDIAAAGGTTQALIVNPATAGQDFLNAMNAIRGQALTCEFTLPQPDPPNTINPSLVNVLFNGNLIFKVANEAACDPTQGGWHYNDEAAPTRILLCPASCNQVTNQTGRIDVELGCISQPPPPA